MRPKQKGNYSLLCEQSDVGRCTEYKNINQWYNHVKNTVSALKIRRKKNPERVNFKIWEQSFLSELSGKRKRRSSSIYSHSLYIKSPGYHLESQSNNIVQLSTVYDSTHDANQRECGIGMEYNDITTKIFQ